MRLTVAVDDYLGELARRGRSAATRQKYREVLYPFVATLPREVALALEQAEELAA